MLIKGQLDLSNRGGVNYSDRITDEATVIKIYEQSYADTSSIFDTITNYVGIDKMSANVGIKPMKGELDGEVKYTSSERSYTGIAGTKMNKLGYPLVQKSKRYISFVTGEKYIFEAIDADRELDGSKLAELEQQAIADRGVAMKRDRDAKILTQLLYSGMELTDATAYQTYASNLGFPDDWFTDLATDFDVMTPDDIFALANVVYEDAIQRSQEDNLDFVTPVIFLNSFEYNNLAKRDDFVEKLYDKTQEGFTSAMPRALIINDVLLVKFDALGKGDANINKANPDLNEYLKESTRIIWHPGTLYIDKEAPTNQKWIDANYVNIGENDTTRNLISGRVRDNQIAFIGDYILNVFLTDNLEVSTETDITGNLLTKRVYIGRKTDATTTQKFTELLVGTIYGDEPETRKPGNRTIGGIIKAKYDNTNDGLTAITGNEDNYENLAPSGSSTSNPRPSTTTTPETVGGQVMTKEAIKKELDKLEIEYNKNATKTELEKLLKESESVDNETETESETESESVETEQ